MLERTSASVGPVRVTEQAVLIRINQTYRPGMSDQELYDATRGIWKMGERREHARFAFAVFRGSVAEVYEIAEWFPAGSTPYLTRRFTSMERAGRWEFTGRRAPLEVRAKYLGADVSAYFKQGNQ